MMEEIQSALTWLGSMELMRRNDTMSGEEQERFEDYLELETYIEELQAGRVVHPPKELTHVQARIYLMALLFHSTSPEASGLRQAFVDALQVTLEQELQQMAQRQRLPLESEQRSHNNQWSVSRRSLLTNGAAVAASLVLGAAAEHAIEQIKASHPITSTSPASSKTSIPVQNTPLVPFTVPSTWHFVTPLSDLGEDALRFITDTIVGYVLRTTGQGNHGSEKPVRESEQIIALSAVCTHMGCLVQWQHADRQFHCPCHGGIFAASGVQVVAPGANRLLPPLPQLATKIEHGNLYVRVPLSKP
ncbi:MAG: ubiquinol-cytochrome c reductase iron-sulfur subunit [Ktedonobacteraceae bacterium]